RVEWQDGKVEERYKVKANQLLLFKQEEARQSNTSKIDMNSSFQQVSLGELKLLYRHSENEYNDFEKEILLPYKQSTLGPCLAKADVDGDGKDDVFIGGAAGQAGGLFIQADKGFQKQKYTIFDAEDAYEDLDALFFDVDADGDQDLFVVSGGNAFIAKSKNYENRLYINDGVGNFTRSPQQFSSFSGGEAMALDYDKDGDLDLIEGNRIIPQQYPKAAPSFIYRNDDGQFTEVTETVAPDLSTLGIINDLVATDINGDGWHDFIAVGEWHAPAIFKNEKGKFRNISGELGVSDLKGWYFSVEEMDANKDGLPDYLIGNVGLNTKFKASAKTPFKVFANDFDDNGSYDVVLSTTYKNEDVPVRGRECSSQQMPFIKDKFPTYDAFAKAALPDIYGDKLDSSLALEATEFRSFLLINQPDGGFRIEYLPAVAQQFPILDMSIRDLNKDGFEDAILVGNIYNTEVETPRWDAGSGLVLYGDQRANLVAQKNARNELYIDGNVKSLLSIQHGGKDYLIAGRNNDLLRIFEIKE
ncbi:MAG: VCBS repeat-containing protein, partial [Bacteroidota bacterium]